MRDETEIALYQNARMGDADAAEVLLFRHRGLVGACVRRLSWNGWGEEDLMQEGMLGLFTAIRHFDPDKGVAFSTFAVPHIMGNLRRWMQKNGALSMSRRDSVALQRMRRLENTRLAEGKAVHLSELSREANMRPIDAAALLLSTQRAGACEAQQACVSFDEREVLDRVDLERAATRLTPREKEIIFRRYFQNERQAAVAHALGLSQAQISRLEKGILRRLRDVLNDIR